MEESARVLKPRAASDDPEKRLRPDQPHVRERSFSDIFTIFSKRQKTIKKDAWTNTTPLDESEVRRAPQTNKFMYQTVIRPENMNIEWNPWNAVDGRPNQEVKREESEEEPDENPEEEETSGDKALDGFIKTTTRQKNSHKRNVSDSAWSLGSFHTGPPVELVTEVLSGEEWTEYFGHFPKRPDPVVSSSADLYESYVQVLESDTETSNDAVDGRSTEDKETSIKRILDTLKIVEVKQETSKVSSEEPESPNLLPPKLSPTSSSVFDKIFRSSIFYNLPPPGADLPTDKPKSGTRTLGKNKTKLRKSSAEDVVYETIEGTQ